MRQCQAVCFLLVATAGIVRGDEFVSTDKVKIVYQDLGTGEPVVLIHGYLADGNNQWVTPGVVKKLKEQNKYRLIILDNRGHGQSDKPTDADKYGEEMVKDVVGLMEKKLQIKKAHIVGYSMGSWISQKLASRNPELVHSLSLGGAGLLRNREMLGVSALALGIASPDAESLMKRYLGGALTLPKNPKHIEALTAAGLGANKLMIDSTAKPYTGKVLGLIGKEDEFFRSSMDALEKSLPQMGKAVVVPGTHLAAFESPAFHNALVAFLAANPMK